MARVAKQKPGRQNAGAGHLRGSKASKQRKRQKVVLESVSQEKNKLRSVISFRAEPPPGYTFIPAGNPELTSALKEFARRSSHKIYSVSTTPHASRHELSREVHRIGFHFPTEVVSQVCAHYGIRLTSGGRLIDETQNNDNLFKRLYQRGHLAAEEKVQDQVTINTEAKQTIRDLFPNIPDKDLFQIIKTAFQLGDGKVGTADEIPLVRRAQLSVVAHIRHVYTEYDKLLRRVPYNEARHRVEKETLKKLVEFRGDDDRDDDASRRAVEDVFKEVIVISDEEDSDSDVQEAEQIGHDHLRVEELPSYAYGAAQGRPFSPERTMHLDEAPSGYRFVPQVARRYRPAEADTAIRERSRYAIWDQARQEFRSGLSQSAPLYERVYVRDPEVASPRQMAPLQSLSSSGTEFRELGMLNHGNTLLAHPVRTPESPAYFRGDDGILYERIVSRRMHESRKSPQKVYQSAMAPLPPGPTDSRPVSLQHHPRADYRRTPSLDAGEKFVVPSIEGPSNGFVSPRLRTNPFEFHRRPQPHKSDFEPASQRVPVFIDLTNSGELPNKRRRVDENSSRYPSGTAFNGEPHETKPRRVQREVHEPIEVEALRSRRVLLPGDDLRTHRVEERAVVDAYGRRLFYDDHALPYPVRRTEADLNRRQDALTTEPPRVPLEAVRVDHQYLEPPYRQREYLPVPPYERPPVASLYDQNVLRETRAPPASFVLAPPQPRSDYPTTRRSENLPPPTYLRH